MKKIALLLCSSAFAGLLSWAGVVAAGDDGLVLDDAWIRAMPPGMKMTAGFGQLRNTGPDAVELTAFTSPQFGDVSLHRTELEDGVSRMREIPALVIEPRATLALEPGGYHLMLMMPAAPLAAGQTVIVDMIAGDDRVFRFEMPVERR